MNTHQLNYANIVRSSQKVLTEFTSNCIHTFEAQVEAFNDMPE